MNPKTAWISATVVLLGACAVSPLGETAPPLTPIDQRAALFVATLTQLHGLGYKVGKIDPSGTIFMSPAALCAPPVGPHVPEPTLYGRALALLGSVSYPGSTFDHFPIALVDKCYVVKE